MWNWKVIFEEWATVRRPTPPVSADAVEFALQALGKEPTGNGVTTAELFDIIGEPGLSEEVSP